MPAGDPDGRFDDVVATFGVMTGESPVAVLLAYNRPDATSWILAANDAAAELLRRDDLADSDYTRLVEAPAMPMWEETARRTADGRTYVVARIRPFRRGDGTSIVLNGFAVVLRRDAEGSLLAVALVEPRDAWWVRRLLDHDTEVTVALAEIRAALLRGDDIDDVLGQVCDRTRELMEADSTGLLEVVGDRVVLRAGDRVSGRPVGFSWPIAEGEIGAALLTNRLIRSSSVGPELRSQHGDPVMPELGEGVVHMALAPVEAEGRANFGALAVRRRSEPFTEEKLSVLEAFAHGVGETLGVAAGRAELERLRVLEVRQGIARDLHDEVIQDLIGLRLQLVGLVPTVADPDLARSLEEIRDELNRTTMRLRDVVAGLQEEPADHFEDAVHALTGSRAERQGLDWTVAVDGPVDDLAGAVRSEILRVLNESVSNVLRHAAASRVDVRLVADTLRVELTVTDDGIGPDGAADRPGMGLENLRERARDRGGECRLTPAADGGSVLTWWVPAPEPESGPVVPAPGG